MRRKIPRAAACWFCGARRTRLRQHHLVPVLRGGDHSPENLVDSCQRCDFAKGLLNVREFRQLVVSVMRVNGFAWDHVRFYGEGGGQLRWPKRYLPNRRPAPERVPRAAASVASHLPCRWCDAWLPVHELASHQPHCPRKPRKSA